MDRNKLIKILKSKFDTLDRAYLNLLGEQEEKILLSFVNSFKRVRRILDEVYHNFGDTPTITELRKYNRLQSIEKNLLEVIKELENELKISIYKQRKYSLVIGKRDTAKILNDLAEIEFVTTGFKKEQLTKYLDDNIWYDSLKESTAKLYNDVKLNFETVLRANAREEIIGGAMEGMSLRELSKVLQERFNISSNRAKVIAQTEMHKFYNIGRNDSINEAIGKSENIFGIKAYKVWRHNHIGKPRPEHLKADGSIADEDGYFDVGGERLQAPGLGTDPANNINCHCTIDFVLDIKG